MMSLQRRLWEAVEPLHAVVYFAPETAAAAKAVGLPSWWMGYFAGRVAPLGPLLEPPVTAMLFGFAPRMVARSLPDAWKYAEPAVVLRSRMDAVEAALGRILPADAPFEELADLLEQAVTGCDFAARPLAAAWSSVDRPASAAGRVWLAATVLREHRGDGHVLSAVAAGLRGLDTTLTHIGTGAVTREVVQINRGWSDDDWDESVGRLTGRGILDGELKLTEAGIALRQRIEDETDRLATGPLEALGTGGAAEVERIAVPLSRRIFDAGAIPLPNPMGAPRP
ncbi:SCO6745 family protein [Amycolatopsis sp. cmx-11-12]|uniref:SCO6745 family protein n=1 Tax=Amycolatopsis sp. cmx-11-12 TaxID=2785795 RepID=UPI0039181D31